ncbi:ArnT family glycosyltransferase [Marinicella meishanensis]|uniref:ArnT family glycosyltransferase n=1 Tax=Marinicella meishanensis TaxID=2873263 RepID=UPI001CC14C0C|nr:phospholipid carrier-dependent glycosyltransferase [Marinicella sp. NBU2979]
MLTSDQTKRLFWLVYAITAVLQLFAISRNELFGDEAFYWLEGQWLSWSYSEVPGWTPWTLAAADWLFPAQHGYLRLPGLLAALSLPWLARRLALHLGGQAQTGWIAALFMLSLPLLAVAGTLAIPDIWLVFFTLLAVVCLHQAVSNQLARNYLWLGVVLALGVNVHLRFWIIVLLAGIGLLWHFRQDAQVVQRFLSLSLPVLVLGFLPIVLFNWQHDFPLLAFQLQDRHPWTFQAAHLGFFVVQVVLTTPLVFALCLAVLRQPAAISAQQKLVSGLLFLAVSHWLLYAVAGFFSDNLRFNWHWTLVSYVLLLVLAAGSPHIRERFKHAAWMTGVLGNWLVLGTLLYWQHAQSPPSALNTRITNNAVGWQSLAEKTRSVLAQQGSKHLITDQFMTLATMAFYAPQIESIQSLSHPLNRKHGRQQQLALMNRLYSGSEEPPRVLLVEQTAMDLTQRIDLYRTWCEQLGGLRWLDHWTIKGGMKTFHYLQTQAGVCQTPPAMYLEQNQGLIQGWVLEQSAWPITAISAITPAATALTVTTERVALGQDDLFADLPESGYRLLQFSIHSDQDLSAVQIQLNWQGGTIRSQLHHF